MSQSTAMQTVKQASLLLAFTLLAAVAAHFLHPRAPVWFLEDEPPASGEVTLEHIREKWHGDVLWVDARTRGQYEAAHIPGALLLNEQEADALLFDHFAKLQDNRKPIVVYCDAHACQSSRKMAAYLRERLPGAQVVVLRGGWKVWQAAERR